MGYIDAGYVVCLSALFVYGTTLALRLRLARHRRASRPLGETRDASTSPESATGA